MISVDYVACEQLIDTPGMAVTRYNDRWLACDHAPAPIVYDNQIKVLETFANHSRAERSLRAYAWIETATAEQVWQYNVSWQVLTPDGQNIRQIDKHMHDSSVLPWSRIEMSTDGMTPGDYRLVLILYRSDTGVKARFVDHETDQETGFLTLLEFIIAD